MEPELSIIVPMYNEAHRIDQGVRTILAYLSSHYPSAEVILVDDGSRDATAARAEELVREYFPDLGKVISFPENRGKGAAVREGMLSASGALRVFADADNSTPIEELDRLLPLVDSEKTIVIGSRGLGDSQIEISQPLWRQTMGKAFNLLPRLCLSLPYKDTQCGFKLFGKTAAHTCFSKQSLEGFAFDVELLSIAKQEGFPVKEVPVRWINNAESSVNPVTDSLKMARDIFRIRWKHRKRNSSC